jgi:hypothetical protein
MGHCYTVKDGNGVGLANFPYVYRFVAGTNPETIPTKDEARRLAVNFVKWAERAAGEKAEGRPG